MSGRVVISKDGAGYLNMEVDDDVEDITVTPSLLKNLVANMNSRTRELRKLKQELAELKQELHVATSDLLLTTKMSAKVTAELRAAENALVSAHRNIWELQRNLDQRNGLHFTTEKTLISPHLLSTWDASAVTFGTGVTPWTHEKSTQ